MVYTTYYIFIPPFQSPSPALTSPATQVNAQHKRLHHLGRHIPRHTASALDV